MDEICRLCLKVSFEMACKLGDDSKIKLCCLNIQLQIHNSLPSFICQTCFDTLVDFQSFRDSIIQNEHKLQQLLNNSNRLNNFYQNLKNNISVDIVKTEANDKTDSYCDESFHCDSLDQSNIKFNPENNHIGVLKIQFKTENETDKNNTLKTTPESKQRKAKRKISSHNNVLTKMKRKSNGVKIPKTINNVIKNEINITGLEGQLKLPNFDEEENSEDLKNGTDIEIKEHKCLTCFNYLASRSELIKHYKTTHSYYNNMEIDNSEKTGLKVYENDEFSSKKNTKDIETPMESENCKRPYICKVCGHTFTSVYSIVRHGRAHREFYLHCSHSCGYSTVYRGALKDHEKRHNMDFKYKCATCGAGFHVKTWHDQHQNIHKNVKPFVCDLCGMAFHMHRYLTSHRATAHREVKGNKYYICPHCDLTCYNKRTFRTHLEEHIGKKSYLCDLCGKVCATREQLKSHSNSHLGLKPFSCSICNKKFAKKFNLSVHKKAHAGEKHLCQRCGKYFAQRSTLLRHARTRHPDVGITEDKSNPDNNKALSFTNY